MSHPYRTRAGGSERRHWRLLRGTTVIISALTCAVVTVMLCRGISAEGANRAGALIALGLWPVIPGVVLGWRVRFPSLTTVIWVIAALACAGYHVAAIWTREVDPMREPAGVVAGAIMLAHSLRDDTELRLVEIRVTLLAGGLLLGTGVDSYSYVRSLPYAHASPFHPAGLAGAGLCAVLGAAGLTWGIVALRRAHRDGADWVWPISRWVLASAIVVVATMATGGALEATRDAGLLGLFLLLGLPLIPIAATVLVLMLLRDLLEQRPNSSTRKELSEKNPKIRKLGPLPKPAPEPVKEPPRATPASVSPPPAEKP